MAQELASRGITVNCVAPGFIRTAMTDALDDKQKAALVAVKTSGRAVVFAAFAVVVVLPVALPLIKVLIASVFAFVL